MQRIVLVAAIVFAFGQVSQADEVFTIAGTGKAVYSGDGGPAVKAGVAGPFGVCIGPDGGLYICEESNHVIRRLDPKTGQLSTVAGTGERGYSGDGGPATQAKLNEPYEIRFDQKGNLFFVEMRNHIVRRVEAKTGMISTIAGTGKPGFGGDNGPATKAAMKEPHSIALDNAGQSLHLRHRQPSRPPGRICKTGIIETFSGTGEKKRHRTERRSKERR